MENHVAAFRAGVREWLDSHDLTPAPAAGHSLDAQVAQLSRVRCALYEAGGCATGGLPRPARRRLAGGDGLAAVRTVHLLLAPDRLPVQPAGPAARGGAAYLSAYTARYRSRETQRRLAAGGPLGPETSVDKILLQTAEQQLYDTVRDLLPGVIELSDSPWRPEFLYSRAATIYGGTAEIQRNIIARRLLDLGKE